MGKIWMPGGGGGADLDVITAGAGDVLAGKVIVDKDGEPLTGTLALSGNASDAQVLSGQTYYNSDPKTKRTGTMPNRGAVSQALGINGTYTIPAGYHNGSGKVTQSIATMAGQTITPGTSQQTVSSSGKYMTGNVVVNAVSNLTAANIKKGAVVGGVTGTFQGYVPTATDLYLRGNNIAGFTAVNATFESGQITLQGSAMSSVLLTASFNLTGYNYLNIEGYTTNSATAQRQFYLQRNTSGSSWSSIVMDTGTFGPGNYTRSLNISAFSISGAFRILLFQYEPNLYRIWLS